MTWQSDRPLIDVRELLELLGEEPIQIIDTRWKLGSPDTGRELFRAEHIPGALHLDMDRDLAGEPGKGGRHPLPSAQAFAETMSGAGVDGQVLVVAYDGGDGLGAARLWWLLRHFGHEQVAVLDGGLPAWKAAGQPVESQTAKRPPRRHFIANPRSDDTVEAEELWSEIQARQVLVLDARGPERWRGDVEPVDKQPGRIPGSVNAPAAENIRDGRFLPASELRERYQALRTRSGREVVVSCGSGVSACVDLLAMELAGLGGARLYPGSYSGWVANNLPVEQGPPKG